MLFVVRALAEQTSVAFVRIRLFQVPLYNVMWTSSRRSHSHSPRLCGRDAG
jgi:hypothetical protein